MLCPGFQYIKVVLGCNGRELQKHLDVLGSVVHLVYNSFLLVAICFVEVGDIRSQVPVIRPMQ